MAKPWRVDGIAQPGAPYLRIPASYFAIEVAAREHARKLVARGLRARIYHHAEHEGFGGWLLVEVVGEPTEGEKP